MPKLMYRDSKSNEFTPLSIEPLDCYPVGSFYTSYNDTSPADMFGGTWTQVTGRFLYATTNTATGGASSHKHFVPIGLDSPSYDRNQIQLFAWHDANYQPMFGRDEIANAQSLYLYFNINRSDEQMGGQINATGSKNMYSNTVSSLPPYQGVYCWYRTA